MTIVYKNRYGLAQPYCGEDQIRELIAVHIAGSDLQAASRCDEQNRLPSGSAQLQLNPVIRAGNTALTRLDSDQVGTMVAVEVRDRELQAGAD